MKRVDTRHLDVNEMSIAEVAWLAGIIEGEGTFGAYQRETGKAFRLAVGMTDQDIIDRIYAITGIGSIRYVASKNPKHKDKWVWQVGNCKNVLQILDLIAPYLGNRRKANAEAVVDMAMVFLFERRFCKYGHDKTNNAYENGTCKTCSNTRNRKESAKRYREKNRDELNRKKREKRLASV